MSEPERKSGGIGRRLARRRWDLERFGLTPSGLMARVRPPDAPRILAISIPKSGTHLVERTLCLHPLIHRRLARKVLPAQLDRLERLLAHQRPGELICGHIHHSQRAAEMVAGNDTFALFVVRNPRDVVISQAHYVYRNTEHQWHQHVAAMPDLRDRVSYFIRGDEAAGIASIGGVLDLYAGWLETPARLVRFEDLVAAADAGRAAIAALYGDLGIQADGELVDRVSAALVSPLSVTFRRGSAGGWQEVFDDRLDTEYRASVGPRLESFGYE